MSRCSLDIPLQSANDNHRDNCPCFCCAPVEEGQVWEVLPGSTWGGHGECATVVSVVGSSIRVDWGKSGRTSHNVRSHIKNMRLRDEADSNKESG